MKTLTAAIFAILFAAAAVMADATGRATAGPASATPAAASPAGR